MKNKQGYLFKDIIILKRKIKIVAKLMSHTSDVNLKRIHLFVYIPKTAFLTT